MAVGSNINANFPIPGLDQSSKGFRDNFATIKKEIEDIQGTTIQLTGGITSDPYEIGAGNTSIVINTSIVGGTIALNPPNHAIQFNADGSLIGDDRLVFNQSDLRVGIGTSEPELTLDVRGDVRVAGIQISDENDPTVSRLTLIADGTSAYLSYRDGLIDLGTDSLASINLLIGGTSVVTVDTAGNMGIGTDAPTAKLAVNGLGPDLAHFDCALPTADNMIRASTLPLDSSIAWGLEHKGGNWVGGIRLSSTGIISLHAGENNGAQLSTSSSRLVIDPAGRVGIGVFAPTRALEVDGDFSTLAITDASIGADRLVGINQPNPSHTLDINGDIALTGAQIYLVSPLTIDTSPVVIDAWPMSEFRTARYTIQCRLGTAPSEQVEIYEYAATHANGTAYGNLISSFDTSGPLGSISVDVNSGFVEVSFTGTGNGNQVTMSRTYIRN